jgi:hypothetical protein
VSLNHGRSPHKPLARSHSSCFQYLTTFRFILVCLWVSTILLGVKKSSKYFVLAINYG